jgi:hypothetical protein
LFLVIIQGDGSSDLSRLATERKWWKWKWWVKKGKRQWRVGTWKYQQCRNWNESDEEEDFYKSELKRWRFRYVPFWQCILLNFFSHY